MGASTPDEMAEFEILSSRIADRKATEAEHVRWRELRTRLARPPAPAPSRGPPPRAHPRVTKKLRFSYTAEKAMPVGFTDEVSAGGMRMTLHHHVDDGALFLLRLQLAGPTDPDPLSVTAKVVWTRRDGNHFQVGLEFVGLRPDEKERLEAYALSVKDVPPPDAK
jgi:hypothetical protein